MLEGERLFLARATIVGDDFEGSFPQGQDPLSRIRELLPEGALDNAKSVNLYPGKAAFGEVQRQWTLLSCWHASDVESAAMWRLYSKSSEAVAIRSTVQRLRRALGTPPPAPKGFAGSKEYHVGMVQYIDYSQDRIPVGNVIAPFFRKRKSFEHEKELRVLLSRFPITEDDAVDYDRRPHDNGVLVPVDLRELIGGVYVAPNAPQWFHELVERVTRRYDLDVEVHQSALDASPLY